MKRIFGVVAIALVSTILQSGNSFGQFTTYDGELFKKGEYTFSAFYSNVGTAEVQSLKLESALMKRSVPYRVVLPPGYAASKERYAVVYLLHGLTGHYDNWTDKTRLANYADDHRYIIVTPEGADGWYTDSVAIPNDKYESYIVKELIPEIDTKFRTLADRDHRVIAGLSMGGYGSIKFGLKYPEMFTLIGSFSGALNPTDIDLPGELTGFQKIIQTSITAAFGPRNSEARKSNDIFRMVREITPEKMKTLPYIYESCATEDPLVFPNDRQFDSLLIEKMVPHEYREHPGGHDWVFWDDQVREFLMLVERRINTVGGGPTG